MVAGFYRRGAQFVLTGRPRHAHGLSPYRRYLAHLASSLPGMTIREQFEGPYNDFLQIPLQPLGDNLESTTYAA